MGLPQLEQNIQPTGSGEPEQVVLTTKPETFAKIAFEKFMKNKLAVIGAIVLIILIGSAIFAPWLAHYDPATQAILDKLAPPGAKHWMGTDRLGRDTFARVLYGGRVSLVIGFLSTFGLVIIGTIIGGISGYFGGWIDSVMMRIVDVFISFPLLFLLITLVTIFNAGSIWTLIIIFSLFTWMGVARIVRGEFLSLRTREFVLALKTMGISNWKIIFTHIVPNTIGTIIVAATLNIGNVILAEAGLSFLGLGVQPPTPSWGNMLTDAQNLTIMVDAWWYPLFPGLMIVITVLCFNFVGDGLRDAFDPKITR